MRYIFSTSLLLFSFFIISTAMVSQSIVKGTVENELGMKLAGASITEKNTANIVTTSGDGSFSISLKAGSGKLVISAKGYAVHEVTIRATTELRVVLRTLSTSGHRPREVMDREIKSKDAVHSKPVGMQLQGSAPGLSVNPIRSQRMVSPNSYQIQKEFNTEDYDAISENRFHSVSNEPLSTFSIDVDAASYSNVRRYLTSGTMPPPGAVRIEELINYFKYNYPQPPGDKPFSVSTELSVAPWNAKHQLVRIGMQGKNIPVESLPASNLVFLIDVSGSMMPENKLPLVIASLKLLVDQMREKDRVAIVVYAGSAGLVLPSTSGSEKNNIKSAIDRLEAGGSTAGGAGIELAYKVAMENFLDHGNNRVILCTDGDFNVGQSSDASLEELIAAKRKSNIFLTVLGYGMGNYKDNKMQKLADKGNGNHAYIDGMNEAKKVLVNEFGGTLFTIAKDVKLQVEFNPAYVQSYRPIAPFTNELLTVKLRYKEPKGDLSKLLEQRLQNRVSSINDASQDLRFAASVAEFGMLLGNSAFKQGCTYEDALRLAMQSKGDDREGYRSEFIELIKLAGSMSAQVRN